MSVDSKTAAKNTEHELVDPRNLEFHPIWSFEHGRFAVSTPLASVKQEKQTKGTHCSTNAGISKAWLTAATFPTS